MQYSNQPNKKGGIYLKNWPAYFFATIFGITTFLLWEIFSPFIHVIIFSAILATVTHPIYQFFIKKTKENTQLSAILSCLLVLFLIVLPMFIFFVMLSKQALNMYESVKIFLADTKFESLFNWGNGNPLYDLLGGYNGQFKDITNFVQETNFNLKESLSNSAEKISGYLISQSAKIISSVFLTVFNLLLMLFCMFYFYKDGEKILKRLIVLSPLPFEHEVELFKKFKEIGYASLYGNFLTAICQGIVAGIGYGIAGLPSPIFWATATAIFSFVPVIGTGLIWLPAGLIMLLMGNISGLFILIWGTLIVGTVDNVLRVFFIGSNVKLNPVVTFMAILGGIAVFDLIGVIYGPMILVLFYTLIHIYEIEYKDILRFRKPPEFFQEESNT